MTPKLNMRFVIVDDDDGDQYLLKRLLDPYAESFTQAKCMDDAVRLCQQNEFDVMILDLNLTDSSWRATLDQIHYLHQLRPKMRIIVCSGVPEPDLKQKSLEAGAEVFLPKDQNLYRDGGKALLIAVRVAMLHATPDDSFWPHVRALREMVDQVSETHGEN